MSRGRQVWIAVYAATLIAAYFLVYLPQDDIADTVIEQGDTIRQFVDSPCQRDNDGRECLTLQRRALLNQPSRFFCRLLQRKTGATTDQCEGMRKPDRGGGAGRNDNVGTPGSSAPTDDVSSSVTPQVPSVPPSGGSNGNPPSNPPSDPPDEPENPGGGQGPVGDLLDDVCTVTSPLGVCLN